PVPVATVTPAGQTNTQGAPAGAQTNTPHPRGGGTHHATRGGKQNATHPAHNQQQHHPTTTPLRPAAPTTTQQVARDANNESPNNTASPEHHQHPRCTAPRQGCGKVTVRERCGRARGLALAGVGLLGGFVLGLPVFGGP